jgi:trimethylamine:corrinoid methyltransferase-like protein
MMKTMLGGEGESAFRVESPHRLSGTASEAKPTDRTNSRLFTGSLLPAYSTEPADGSNLRSTDRTADSGRPPDSRLTIVKLDDNNPELKTRMAGAARPSGERGMLIDDPGKEKIVAEIFRILEDIGLKVETEEMRRALTAIGCPERPGHRISIPKKLVEEIAGRQKKAQAEDAAVQELYYTCNIDWTHAILWRRQIDEVRRALDDRLLVSAFDCGPTKYYDYRQQKSVGVDTETFIEMKKLAQSIPEIGYVANWYRSDVPPKLERLESLILAFEYTDKSAGVEAIDPEVIKYLKRASDILSHGSDDEPGTYLAGAECIIPPLILDDRSGRDILERKRCGIRKYHVATMGALAISLPITIAGAVAVSAAELLGGWSAVYAVDPEARFNARAISNGIDMRTGQPSYAGPEIHLINLGVKEIFDEFFGGHCWVDVFFSPSVANPGLRAVYENFYGSLSRTRLSG